MFFFHPFELLIFIIGTITISTGFFALKRKNIPGINYLFPLLFSLAIWCFVDLSALIINDIEFKLMMAKFRYTTIGLISILFLLFTLDYSNIKQRFSKNIIIISFIFPIITTIISFTNGYHSLMWTNYSIIPNSGDISMKHGIWFWISTFYYFSILFLSFFILVSSFKKASQLYRLQLFLIMASLTFPVIFNIIFITASFSGYIYDLTPLAFSMTGIMIYFSISSLRSFDIIPVSKDIIIDNMNEGILILDETLTISDFNQNICTILGLNTLNSLHPVLEKIPILADYLKSNDNFKSEVFLHYCNKNILLDVSVLKDHSNRIIGKLIIITDFTQQREYEANLKKEVLKSENANKAKSEFIANLSHEIRTPLNAIIGFSEIIESKLKDQSLMHYFEGIKNSSRTLLGLINDILDLSKSEVGKIKINYSFCDISSIISSVKNIFSFELSKKKIEFKVMLHHNIPKYIYIDELRLKQILINLIGNAVKFTDSGAVTVEVVFEPYENAGKLMIKVKDSGIGIQESQLETIFDAFSQQDGQDNRKYGGTGLGLTITRKLIELMDGKIEVSSSYGKGSVFIVSFSNVSSRGEINVLTEVQPIPENLSFEGLKILYAEDNEMNRMVVSGLLTHYNATVIEAVNGQEAVDTAKNEPPNLILMDITMPVMDGLTATKIIRSDISLKNIPILALTATIIDAPTDEALFDDIIYKPFKKEDLLLKIYNNSIKKGFSGDESLLIPKEYHQEIATMFFGEIKRILSGIVMDDVISLAEKISKYSDEKNIFPLTQFSKSLLQNCQNYNIKKIRKSLEDFLKSI